MHGLKGGGGEHAGVDWEERGRGTEGRRPERYRMVVVVVMVGGGGAVVLGVCCL